MEVGVFKIERSLLMWVSRETMEKLRRLATDEWKIGESSFLLDFDREEVEKWKENNELGEVAKQVLDWMEDHNFLSLEVTY